MQKNIKRVIVLLILIIIAIGIFFGLKLYNQSKKTDSTPTETENTDKTRTPFQTKISTSTTGELITGDINNIENPTYTKNPLDKPRLVELWKEPVSGFDFIYKDIEIISTTTSTSTSKSTSNSTSTNIKNIVNKKILKNQEFIYLWDRKTGHIYENLATTTEINKISNYTSPGAQEVFFIDQNSVIVRNIESNNESINTKNYKLTKETASSTIFNTNITDLNISSDNISVLSSIKKVFYFLNKTGKGIITNHDGLSRLNVINTSLSEWLPQYVNKNLISLTTKPNSNFPGYLFFLTPDGTSKNKYILGEKYGFNTLTSPDGNKVIYNEMINGTLEMYIYDVKSKNTEYLSQATIVDKCTWTNDSKSIFCGIPQKLYKAAYPEDWYKNNVTFSDNIWSIDAETGDFRLIIPLQDQVIKPIDVYQIKISNSNKYIIFQDKDTLNLWKYEI